MLRSRRLVGSLWGGLWFGLLMAALLVCPAYGIGVNDTGMPLPKNDAEAWQWMTNTMRTAKGVSITNIHMQGGMLFADCRGCKSGPSLEIDLYNISNVNLINLNSTAYGDIAWFYFPDTSTMVGNLEWKTILPGALENASKFQAALLFLARVALKQKTVEEEAYLHDFEAKALAWQKMTVRPELPVEARRHQVLAEYAYKNKDIVKAMKEYQEALKIYPYWPDGQSNLANLYAEVGTSRGYDLAIFHMKTYLMLVPNPPDAKAAQDSIFIWEDKRDSPAPCVKRNGDATGMFLDYDCIM